MGADEENVPAVVYETGVAVADYVRLGGGAPEAFEAAAADAEGAMRRAERELTGMGLDGVRAVRAEFLEFDSTNPSHACAYFEVTVEGVTQEVLDALALA